VKWHHCGTSGWDVTSFIGNGDNAITCLGGSIPLDAFYREMDV
jgi:hypothetical protein